MQLPLPKQVDAKEILETVDPAKDVDGFHPLNVGKLVAGRPNLVACTPLGMMEILRRSNIPIEGAEAAVIGRSDIVGKPIALLLMHANATVTICHSKTRDLPGTARRADIVVAAMGRPAMITSDYIRPGATVIDVGTNRITDAAEAERIFAKFPERLGKFREKGSALDRRCPSRSCRSRRRDYAIARRRRPAHHRHANEQHRPRRQVCAARNKRASGGAAVTVQSSRDSWLCPRRHGASALLNSIPI